LPLRHDFSVNRWVLPWLKAMNLSAR